MYTVPPALSLRHVESIFSVSSLSLNTSLLTPVEAIKVDSFDAVLWM
jgi:hypothetical protein